MGFVVRYSKKAGRSGVRIDADGLRRAKHGGLPYIFGDVLWRCGVDKNHQSFLVILVEHVWRNPHALPGADASGSVNNDFHDRSLTT